MHNFVSPLRRAVAYLIDSLLLLLLLHIASFLMPVLADKMVHELAFVVIGLVYFSVLQASKKKATFGMSMIGIHVLRENGACLSFFKAAIRYILFWLFSGIAIVGLVPIFFTKRRQTVHDLICKTVVVDATQRLE